MTSCDSPGSNQLQVLSQAQQLDAANDTNTTSNNNTNDLPVSQVALTTRQRAGSSYSISSSDSSQTSPKGLKRINSFLRPGEEEKTITCLNYKSGVVYDGAMRGYRKSGHGMFVWPNGDKYSGEFKANFRHGFGTDNL
jgi:hypothetical protein